MSTFNIWLAVSTQARQAYRDRRQAARDNVPYTGPMDNKTFNILNRIHDLDVVEKLFKSTDIGNKTYTLLSIYTEPGANPAAIQDGLDHLETEWPGHFYVTGVWNVDTGLQAGTSMDEQGVVTGTPVYPIPAVQLLQFMPDVWDETNEVFVTATEIKDVNLLMGQAPRRFI